MTHRASRAATTSAPPAPPTPRISAGAARLPGPASHHWQWQLRAACRALGSNRFFHPAGERGEDREERDAAAKRVCAGCPVREACLEHALRTREPYGVWGGLTEEERRALLVRSRRTGRGPAAAAAAPATAPDGRSGPSGPATRARRK
ncbi:WhiB family transcriptional regulator [Streptomyces sp. NPDC006487]|uniref:WhiB family transcriptional regulator n=1 Tax=Streptomyces sp. NPDC006487 TaxID=3364748 RepID=UPI0036CD42B4